ncbi:hypothetical protein [Bradyrhizobium nanningense]|uniref:hypothetical protein n=1 Tax=Bradyrhizobium nanningense TaxID=1325118 RepID=UPI001008A411|nr:hypothetical protein [Bradyrhizobium nanningense]
MISAVREYAALKRKIRPIEVENFVETVDSSHGMTHGPRFAPAASLVSFFPDRPRVKGGLSCCMNSASSTFVRRSDFDSDGYGGYVKLFAKQEA